MVQRQVFDIIDKKILVGHAIHHDLEARPPAVSPAFDAIQVLMLKHKRTLIRDTSKYKPLRELVCCRLVLCARSTAVQAGGKTPGLKLLTKVVLGA